MSVPHALTCPWGLRPHRETFVVRRPADRIRPGSGRVLRAPAILRCVETAGDPEPRGYGHRAEPFPVGPGRRCAVPSRPQIVQSVTRHAGSSFPPRDLRARVLQHFTSIGCRLPTPTDGHDIVLDFDGAWSGDIRSRGSRRFPERGMSEA